MLTLDDALNRADALVSAARKAGADAADVVYGCDASSQVAMRLGALESVESSESEHIGLRVFIGQRSSTISSSDMAPRTLSTLIDRAIAMAREAPEDIYAGLAPEDRLMRKKLPSLDIEDESEPDAAALRERALIAEEAARYVPGVTNSEGAGAGHGRVHLALATSHGFAGAYARTSHSTWASVIAGEGESMQRDHASHSACHLTDLDTSDAIGQRAGSRAVARLNPSPPAQRNNACDLRSAHWRQSHHPSCRRHHRPGGHASFHLLLDSKGEQILPHGLTIVDDPLRSRGLRSRPFDGEGLPVARTAIVDNGVLTGWLLDSASARQLGVEPTGHATRGGGGSPGAGPTNLHLEGGIARVRDLFADVECGLYVTELIGQGVNGVTGDYSRGQRASSLTRAAFRTQFPKSPSPATSRICWRG